MTAPTVGVVVVNHEGGDLTLDCLRSLVRSEWPAAQLRVVLVDNASHDGVVARVRAELPVVRVLEQATNDGFGAGCNAGIRALGDVDHVALVNNDAVVDPGWLRPLVDALEADELVAAACPKILFAGRFVDVELRSATARRGVLDRRDLGVLLAGARVDDVDVWPRMQLVEGTWGLEPDAGTGVGVGAEWTRSVAHLRVPAPDDGARSTLALLLSSDGDRAVSLRAGDATVEHTVGPEPAWYEAPMTGNGNAIVNNVGTVIDELGFAADRGYLEPDDGRFDVPADVAAWCGAGVLLRRDYLDDVGLFAEDLFVYYEDVDLSLRGTEHGWRYVTVPASVVRHVHAATSGRSSPLKQFYDERNRLLVLARHRGAGAASAAAVRSLLVTASYARRDVVAPLLHGHRARPDIVTRRLHAWGSAVGAATADTRRRPRRGKPRTAQEP